MAMIYYRGHKAKSEKRKRTKGKVQRKPGASFQRSSRSGVPNSPAITVTVCVKCCLPRKLIRDLVPKVFTAADHPSTHCLACTKISTLPEESRCLAQTTLFAWFRQ